MAVFGGCGRFPVDGEVPPCHGYATEVGDGDIIRREADDLVLSEFNGTAGEVDESGDVRSQEVFPVAEAHHERGIPAGRHDEARVVGMHGQNSERAFQLRAGPAHRGGKGVAARPIPNQTAVVIRKKCRRDLGIGFRKELVAPHCQPVPQWRIVLDDPLCMTASRSSSARCGWAFASVGAPCVAQRVCPIPTAAAGNGSVSTSAERFASRPAFLRT
ncbi:hypothetical protein AHiyo6_11850 [Arthrobacter sp. Hiyo6]|nr:hypothetical protein AHiyo6_11850 [Arthrobacter sp. Hiyo6]